MPEHRTADPADIADADVRQLLAALPAVRISPITSLAGTQSARASYRVQLRNGSSVKLRRLGDAFEAERVTRLTRHLDSAQIPQVCAHRGAAVIEPWIEGRLLDGLPADYSRMRACGALLGKIHATPTPADAADQVALAREERRTRFDRNVGALRAMAAINSATAEQLFALARDRPEPPAIGLIHGDFCAANLIEATDGRIVAIDNETLRFEALDYDLARTWYRWAMSDAEADAFLAGYRTRRDPSAFLRAFGYWAACALIDAAVFRQRAGTGEAALPLQRLAGLLSGSSARWSITR